MTKVFSVTPIPVPDVKTAFELIRAHVLVCQLEVLATTTPRAERLWLKGDLFDIHAVCLINPMNLSCFINVDPFLCADTELFAALDAAKQLEKEAQGYKVYVGRVSTRDWGLPLRSRHKPKDKVNHE